MPVNIERKDHYVIATDKYRVEICPFTGCPRSIIVKGRELLQSGVFGFMPGYVNNAFYQPLPVTGFEEEAGVLKAFFGCDMVPKDGGFVREDKEMALMVYTFEEDSFSLKLRASAGGIFMHVQLGHGVRAVRDKGAFSPFKGNFEPGEYTWAYRDSAVTTTGDFAVHTPPVCRFAFFDTGILEQGAEKELTFAPAELSAGELDEVYKAVYPAGPGEGPLSLYSPADLQVFQRQDAASGSVYVAGKAAAGPAEAVLSGTDALGNGFSRTAVFPVREGTFSGYIPAPAGGWYTLEIRTPDGATASVGRVGVGEVFVGAGQSNATNSGQFPIKQYSGMTVTTDGVSWRLCDDPMPGVHDGSGGGSYYPALGDLLYKKYNVPIGFASTGHGGTTLEQWANEEQLYKWFMTRVYQLGRSGFRAVLWHQGESDFNTPTDTAFRKMKLLIDSSRREAGWYIPWFVAKVSYHSPENPSWPLIREAHQMIWEDGAAFEGPDTDVLTGDNRDLEGAGIHFSPKGLRNHAELWAEKLIPFLDRVLEE
ncbi:MAG: hypothetical protein IJT95_05285 [Abditibacteriota bacterium]|nr:hypothetical protein [Abditibacteriota bacterium]